MIIKTTSTEYGYFDPSIAVLGQQYQDQYNSAEPFPHIVLTDFLDEAILDLCLNEFPAVAERSPIYQRSQENLKTEFKPEVLSRRCGRYSINSTLFHSSVSLRT